MISTKKPDDKVGQGRKLDDFKQNPEQKAVLGGGGEEGGRPEPKDGWGGSSEAGDRPSRSAATARAKGDRMPAGGATVSNEPASNPKYQPGAKHEA
jgi:hypothetical protein